MDIIHPHIMTHLVNPPFHPPLYCSSYPTLTHQGRFKIRERERDMAITGGNGDYFLNQMRAGGEPCEGGYSTKRSRKGKAAAAGDESNATKKRVMAVIDGSRGAKHAMMWALTHVANKGDLLTLLHVVSPADRRRHCGTPDLADSLGALCKACKPEVEVEALVIEGPKLSTVLSQVKKLETSVLVLSQGKPSLLSCLFRSKSEEFTDQCINKADCLTMAVRKQSKGVGGYLVSTRWQKNFWLLA